MNQKPGWKPAFIVFSAFLVLGPWFLVQIYAQDDQPIADKHDKTQYERRLQMLADRYSHAPAGTVEFPKELMAVDYINEGYKLFQKNQYDLAAEATANALKLDPNSPVAHELAGDLAYLKQDLAQADAHYRAAFSLEPAARLRQKLEKLARENAAEKKMSTVEELHFLIKYDGNQSEYEGFELRMLLHETYLAVAHDLAHYLNHKTTVLFYQTDAFHQVGNLPHWVGGIFDGKVRLPVSPRVLGELQLRAVARHEISHVFIDDLSRKRAPVWLHEGFAVYEQAKVQPLAPATVRALLKPQTIIPFSDLFNPAVYEKHKTDQVWMSRFYVESYNFVDYLIGRYNMFDFKKLVLALADEEPAEQAIHEIYKISAARMEKQWIASL